jgi:hypothetical protein
MSRVAVKEPFGAPWSRESIAVVVKHGEGIAVL